MKEPQRALHRSGFYSSAVAATLNVCQHQNDNCRSSPIRAAKKKRVTFLKRMCHVYHVGEPCALRCVSARWYMPNSSRALLCRQLRRTGSSSQISATISLPACRRVRCCRVRRTSTFLLRLATAWSKQCTPMLVKHASNSLSQQPVNRCMRAGQWFG